MVVGIILIILDILGTIVGWIRTRGYVFPGIAGLIGKHFLLIIGIIIIIVVSKKKKNKEH